MSEPSLPQLVVSHWQPSAVPMLAGAGAALLYLLASSRLRARWPARRTVSFLAGVASVLVALDSGINSYDDRLLSIHMVQHLILLLIAPLLLLCGQPLLLALRALPPKRRSGLARAISRLRRLAHPLACISIFSGAVLFTHLPFFYEATLRHPDLHDAEHAIYVLAGLLLWWPVLDVDPARSRRLGGLGRLAYVLAAMP
ncbi:MAG TPA: cytochrome c oxidase assembly protein, partial [Gammaproteobacteria bacterium]|nr:cytochrome c oxidase assembly protein [Gammaproteobacteria bacterium]